MGPRSPVSIHNGAVITAGDHSLDTPKDVRPESSQWTGWLHSLHPPSGDSVSVDSVLTWLERVEGQLRLRRQGYSEAVTALQGRWQGLLGQPQPPSPAELQQVVGGLLRAVEHLSAADSLRSMVALTSELVTLLAIPAPPPAAPTPLSEVSTTDVLALLDSVSADRTRIASMAAGDLLDILAKVVLALEDGEQQLVGAPDDRHQVFDAVHNQIAKGADELRRRFMVPPTTNAARGLVAGVREAATAMRGHGIELTVDGPEVAGPAAAEAIVWTLQELLHQLRSVTVERVQIALHGDAGGVTTLTVATMSRVFAVERDEPEPAWLLRSRVRMELVDGMVTPHAEALGSSVQIRVR